MIIERPEEVKRIAETKKWCLVYGRRKTGKSFLVENFTRYDDYFFVKRDRTIISKKDGKNLGYETFLELLTRALADGKTVAVDEFQRLGDDFFDSLHAMKKDGKLVLISSTLFLSKKLLDKKSPLLGFFTEIPIHTISLQDALRAVSKHKMGKKQAVEVAILLREPISADYFDGKKPPREILAEIIIGSMRTIPALVGEIFTEEERGMSAAYEAILRAVATGKTVSTEISGYMFSKRLTAKDDPGMIQQYLKNLVEFGIIRKIKVYDKNKFSYRHSSPLLRIFYYADEKYNVSERAPNREEMARIIDELMPRIVEDEIRQLIASKEGLTEAIAEAGDYDIDACLLKFKKPALAVEIKWKPPGKEDVKRAEESLGKIDAKERMLFVPDKREVKGKTALKIADIGDFV